jgi:hypothetical protein
VRAALAALALVAACGDLGCAALASSPIPAATQALEACVAQQLIAGDTQVVQIAVACSVPAGTEILDLVEFLAQQLESAGKVPSGTTAAVKGQRK